MHVAEVITTRIKKIIKKFFIFSGILLTYNSNVSIYRNMKKAVKINGKEMNSMLYWWWRQI